MQLEPGTRLGPYDVAGAIGAGVPPPFAADGPGANFGEVWPKPGPGTP